MRENDLLKILEATQYNQEEEPPSEQVIFRIDFKAIGSLGDFVLFSGRPKSGKTKYLSGAIAASLSGYPVYNMALKLPDGKKKVVHFDTEQSKYSHYKMMQLVKELGNFDKLPDTFKSYRCRSVSAAQIILLIDFYLKNNPDTGIIFLDGLLDIVTSMNDEKHSSFIKSWLKKITEVHNILLISVIHRGFSNDKSIGQIGSEGERAAQSVLLIEKNKEHKQYILKAEYLRDADEFSPVAIQYNNQTNQWQQCDYIEEEKPINRAKVSTNLKRKPNEYDISEHIALLARIFHSESLYSYKILCNRISEIYGVGQQWAKQCVSILERENLIYRTEDGFTNIKQSNLLKIK